MEVLFRFETSDRRWALGCVLSLVVSASAYPAHAQESSSAPDATASAKPLQVASACLERGDDVCVVRALEGRARSPQELGLLIETYRKLGQQERALRVMQAYVERFPRAPRAAAYRELLKASKARPEPSRRADEGSTRSGSAAQARSEPKSPMDQALECLAKGDDACIVRVLEGKAHSAQELGLLCETYVALGDHTHARAAMREYVSHFPNAPRSAHYRNALER